MPREVVQPNLRRRWVLAAAWILTIAAVLWAAGQVRRFLMTDPRFVLADSQVQQYQSRPQSAQNQVTRTPAEDGGLHIQGVKYASENRIREVFTADVGNSVYHAPLAERRRRLLAIDWVEDASVSRFWPNQLVARIRERRPVAWVSLPIPNSAAFRYSLIDAEGVLLSPPPRTRFPLPVLTGITEDQNETDRRERVKAAMTFCAEMSGHLGEVSEINVIRPHDLRAIVVVDHRTVELWLGDQNFLTRYQNFVSRYPELQRYAPRTSTFDLRLDTDIIAKKEDEAPAAGVTH